jgi:hypothetical protein
VFVAVHRSSTDRHERAAQQRTGAVAPAVRANLLPRRVAQRERWERFEGAQMFKGFGIQEFFIIVLIFIPRVFYLRSLKLTLAQCSPDNRSLKPGLVWLQLIPGFEIIWQVVLSIVISKSVTREFNARRIEGSTSAALFLGIAMSTTMVLLTVHEVILIRIIQMPIFWLTYRLIVLILLLVFWLKYWIEVTRLRKKIVVRIL